MKCKYCNATIDDGSSFCTNCGKELSEGGKCIKCGEPLDEGSMFCPYCGTEQSQEQPVVKNKETKTSNKTYGIVLIVVLLCVIGGYYWFTNGQTSSGNANDSLLVVNDSVDVVNDVRPSIHRICSLFEEMCEGKKTALTDLGFKFVDKQSQLMQSDYEDDGNYLVTKEIYRLHYSHNTKTLTLNYISAKDYGDPSMTIECDTQTMNELLDEANNSFKSDGNKSFIVGESNYLHFDDNGVISIGGECSISWPSTSEALSFSDLLRLYNNRQDKSYINDILSQYGFTLNEDHWHKDGVKIYVDAQEVRIEVYDESGNYPELLTKWEAEVEKAGYKSEDSSVGMLNRTDYQKNGEPMVSCGFVDMHFAFCVGNQASV